MALRYPELSSYEHLINQTIRTRLFRRHIVITVGIPFDGGKVVARVFRKDTVELRLRAKDMFGVVSLKSKTLTLKNRETKKTFRLNYVGEPTPPPQAEIAEADSAETESVQAEGAEQAENNMTKE